MIIIAFCCLMKRVLNTWSNSCENVWWATVELKLIFCSRYLTNVEGLRSCRCRIQYIYSLEASILTRKKKSWQWCKKNYQLNYHLQRYPCGKSNCQAVVHVTHNHTRLWNWRPLIKDGATMSTALSWPWVKGHPTQGNRNPDLWFPLILFWLI